MRPRGVHASPVSVTRRSPVSAKSDAVGAFTYPRSVAVTPADLKFADEAGDRFEQAFALCSFASELVGKASE